MKRKILALGLFSLCTLAFTASESQAWPGLLHSIFHHHRYATTITCRPYNAFTPMCWGNLVCDGCCPSFGGGGGCQMPCSVGMPSFAGPCFGGACMASDRPAAAPLPPINNNFTPPMPMPVNPGTTMYPQQGLSQANFYPQGYYPYAQQYSPYAQQYSPYAQQYNSYMPTYNPYLGYYPAPNYWYGR
jgi:hypothetical protein